MISLRLVAYTAGTDTRLGIMPEPTSLQLSIGHNTVGALELTYSQLADQGSLLAGGLEAGLDIGVEVNWGSGWTEPPGCRFLLIKRSTNPADPARMIQLSCPSYAWLAGRVRNLNLSAVEGSKSKHAGERKFASASAGRIVKTLLDEHQDRRGAGVPLTRSGFSNTVDSAGANWAKTKTLYYPVGVDILTVLAALSDIDHCDWRTQGRALQMWNADAHFTDRAATVKLQLGRELGDAPSEETMEDLVTHILVRGEKKVKTTVQNTSGPHPWGYWEGFIDEGGIDSTAEAQDAAQKELAARSRLRGEYTRTLTMSDLPGDSLPFRDYVVGDWVTGPAVVGSQRMRVQQVTVTLDSDGLLAGSVVLNDRVLAAELKRASKLKSITITGPGSTGGSGIAPIPEGPDPRQPAAPTGLTVTDTVYLDAFGMHAVRIKAVWSPVTTATDGTELEIARYELWGQPQGQTPAAVWRRITSSTGTEAEWLPFSPGSQWVFTVLAVGLTTIDPGVQSAPVTVTMGQDTVAPPAPSTPVVTAWLASVQAAWNGRDNTNAEMPADWVETRVHIGTTAGFTPSAANQVDSFRSRTGGVVNLTQATLSYTTPVYVKLVAVDLSGNVGPASAAGSATPRPAYYSDLATSAIDDIIADATDVIMPSVDGKTRNYYQTSAPTGGTYTVGDTWFDTDDSNRIYRWSGSAWLAVNFGGAALADGIVTSTKLAAAVNTAISNAQTAANTAQATADGKGRNYYQTAAPTGGSYTVYDTWFDTDDGHRMYRWSGSAWVAADFGTAALANNAVTSAKLVDDAVTAAKIATDAVTADAIAADAVGSTAILGSAITAAKIATDAVTADAIASNAVGTAELASASVTNAKIANLAVGTAQIADAAIVNAKIGSAAVQSANIQDAAITTAKVNDAAIVTAKIADAAIVNAKIGTAAVGTANIADLAVSGAKIADATIVNAKIADGTIQNAKIGSLDAGKITTGTLSADRIGANTITVDKLIVGDLSNMSLDPLLDAALGANWTPTNVTKISVSGALRSLSAAMTSAAGDSRLESAKHIPVQPNSAYYVEAEIYRTAGVATVGVQFYDDAKTAIGSVVITGTGTSAWSVVGGGATAPASAAYAKVVATGTGATATGQQYWTGFVMRRMASSELIVDGSIVTSKIAAGSITAASGIIADAAITNAKIADATIQSAKIASIDAAKITTGILDANRLAANSVTAEKMVISGGNLLPDPTLQGVAAWTVPASTTRTPTGGYAGDGIVTVPAAATQRDVVTQSTVIDNRRPYLVRVTPGLTYLVQARVKTAGAPTVASGLWVAALGIDAAGAAIGSGVVGAAAAAGVAAGTWSTVQVIFTAPAGAAWMQVQLRAAAAQNTQVIWSTPWALQMASGSLIVDGSIQAKHLEAELVLTSEVIAGPPAATHARMNPAGFSAHGPDPADDVVKSFMRLGSDGLSFGFNPDVPAGRITGLGHASLASAAVGALSVGGETLDEILDPFPRGRIAYAESTSPVTGITTTETPVMELRSTLAPGRLYELLMIGTAARSSVAGDIIEWAIRVAYDGNAVTTSSTLIRSGVRQNLGPATLYVTVPPITVDVSTDGQSGMREARFLLTAKRQSGTGTIDVWGSSGQPAQLKLRDEGQWKPATSTGIRYTSVWSATTGWAHDADDPSTPYDVDWWVTEVLGSAQDGWTQILFGGNAVSGETSQSLAAATSGASIIKAEIRVQVDEAYSFRDSDGKTYSYSPQLRLHPTANTTSNATLPGSYVTSAAFSPPQSRWVDVTSLWTTSHRGLYLSLPPVASGRWGGANGAWAATQIRLTYFR